jgi:hypothetical protein
MLQVVDTILVKILEDSFHRQWGLPPGPWQGAALDPLALFLANAVYEAITKPNPPPVEALRLPIRELLRAMEPEERRLALARARAWGAYASVVREELEQLGE